MYVRFTCVSILAHIMRNQKNKFIIAIEPEFRLCRLDYLSEVVLIDLLHRWKSEKGYAFKEWYVIITRRTTGERHLTVELHPKTPEQDLKSMTARLDTIDEVVAEPLGHYLDM